MSICCRGHLFTVNEFMNLQASNAMQHHLMLPMEAYNTLLNDSKLNEVRVCALEDKVHRLEQHMSSLQQAKPPALAENASAFLVTGGLILCSYSRMHMLKAQEESHESRRKIAGKEIHCKEFDCGEVISCDGLFYILACNGSYQDGKRIFDRVSCFICQEVVKVMLSQFQAAHSLEYSKMTSGLHQGNFKRGLMARSSLRCNCNVGSQIYICGDCNELKLWDHGQCERSILSTLEFSALANKHKGFERRFPPYAVIPSATIAPVTITETILPNVFSPPDFQYEFTNLLANNADPDDEDLFVFGSFTPNNFM